jgi:hypothetical protein
MVHSVMSFQLFSILLFSLVTRRLERRPSNKRGIQYVMGEEIQGSIDRRKTDFSMKVSAVISWSKSVSSTPNVIESRVVPHRLLNSSGGLARSHRAENTPQVLSAPLEPSFRCQHRGAGAYL